MVESVAPVVTSGSPDTAEASIYTARLPDKVRGPMELEAHDYRQERVLALVSGEDGVLLRNLLADVGASVELCTDATDLCVRIRQDTAAVILSAEVLRPDVLDCLTTELRSAPAWSNLPLLILTDASAADSSGEWVQRLEQTAYMTLLERPIRPRTVKTAVRSALHARRRQYEIRDQLQERHRVEEALRESEGKLRALAENIQASFGIVQGERFIYANRYFAQISGYTVDELLSITFPQLVHPDFLPMMVERARRRQRGQPVPNHYQFAMITKSGQKRWVEFSVAAIKYNGQPAIIGTGFDITDRKEAVEALQKSEEQRRLAMKAARMGSWKIDLLRQQCTLDEPCRQIWAAPHWQTVSMAQIFERMHPDDRKIAADSIARIAEPDGTGMSETEFRIFWPDGQIRWLRAAGHVLFAEHDGRQRAVEAVGVTLDITDQKQAEQQLKDLNERLEQLVAQRTAVAERRAEQLRCLAIDLTKAEQRERERLARILHDHLQQLLVGIKFSASMLRTKITGADPQARLRQLSSLVDESLDASRSLVVDLSPPILHKGTMNQVFVWLAEWVHEKHGLSVTVRTDEHADPVNSEIRLLLFQAVRELLLNAVKYAQVKSASVELSRINGLIQVIVSDQGIGFDPAQRFSSQQTEGGFGLFSIRERIEPLSGTVEIQSAPGKGTRVTLTVPATALQPREPSAANLPANEVSGAAEGLAPTAPWTTDRNIRVLLADDHAVVRDGLAKLMQTEPGIEIVGQASDGQTAVDLARNLHPDVILMDVNMPHLDGIEATRLVTHEQPGIRIIGLSMYSEAGVRDAIRSAGATDYLAKTSAPDTLIAAVRRSVNAGSPG